MIQDRMNVYFNHYRLSATPGQYSDHMSGLSNLGTFLGYARVIKLVSGGATMGRTIKLYTEKNDIQYGDIIEYNGSKFRVETIDPKSSLHSSLSFFQVEAVKIDGL